MLTADQREVSIYFHTRGADLLQQHCRLPSPVCLRLNRCSDQEKGRHPIPVRLDKEKIDGSETPYTTMKADTVHGTPPHSAS